MSKRSESSGQTLRASQPGENVHAKTITTPDGTQWFVSVDYDGRAKIVITRLDRPSERFDLDQNERVALVRALSGRGD
jgi:hypothetical protein